MASYTWPDGSKHSISWAQHWQNLGRTGPAKGAPSSTIQHSNTASVPPPDGSNGGSAAAMANLAAPQPYDPSLDIAKLGAGMNIGLANSEASYQTGQTAYNTGYNADGTVNSANPYNQAMLLQRSYQNAQRGTTNDLNNAGQLYSTAYSNAQNSNDFNASVASNQLQNQAQNAYHTIGANQLQTYANNAAGTSGDTFNSLLKSVYGS